MPGVWANRAASDSDGIHLRHAEGGSNRPIGQVRQLRAYLPVIELFR